MIKQATRACYGLFPEAPAAGFIWQLAARSQIAAIYGVSDNGHVFRALRYRLSKGRHFHASYDEFWQSIDGHPEKPMALAATAMSWKENRWRVSPVKNGLNIGGDSSCWIRLTEQVAILTRSGMPVTKLHCR